MSLASRGLAVVLGFAVAFGCGLVGAPAFGVTIPATLDIVAPSELDFSVNLSIGGTDSDSSPIDGFLDVEFEADFSTGVMEFTDFTITGGSVNIVDTLNFSWLFGVQTATATGIGGLPSTTFPPSFLTPPATNAVDGLFDATEHSILINTGTLSYSGTVSGSRNLSTDPLSGASISATPGEVSLTKGAIDLVENTTIYEIGLVLPIEFSDVTSESGVTITSNVSGEAIATNVAVVIDFVETNGIVGDVNQDGVVNGDGTGLPANDDVSAFIEGWLSTDLTPGLSGYTQGDLNFDTKTNLLDAYILHEALSGNGSGSFDLALLNNVPEPTSAVLLLLGGLFFVGQRNRGQRNWDR